MERRKLGSRWVLVAGILIAVLGLIHDAATFVIFGDVGKPYDGKVLASIFTFVATGAAVIFVGLLTVYSSFGLERSEKWAWTVAKGVGMFMIPFGLGAVATMPDNPFAYIGLVAAILEVIPLLIFRHEFKEGLL